MIRYHTQHTKKTNISYLQECFEKKFSNSIYKMTRNGNVILFSYKKSNDSHWANFTLVIKQPVIFMYDEDGNLLAYGTPEGQDDFERTFADICYRLLNELD